MRLACFLTELLELCSSVPKPVCPSHLAANNSSWEFPPSVLRKFENPE